MRTGRKGKRKGRQLCLPTQGSSPSHCLFVPLTPKGPRLPVNQCAVTVVGCQSLLPNPCLPPIYSSLRLSTHPSVCPPIRLSIHPSVHLSTHLSVHPSVHLFIHPSNCLSTHLSIHPSVCLSVRPAAHPHNLQNTPLFWACPLAQSHSRLPVSPHPLAWASRACAWNDSLISLVSQKAPSPLFIWEVRPLPPPVPEFMVYSFLFLCKGWCPS